MKNSERFENYMTTAMKPLMCLFKDSPWFYDLLTLLLQVAHELYPKFCVI